jgi:hypothetical protein
VTGKVVVAGRDEPCPDGIVILREPGHPDDSIETTERDGWWVADSVRPGTYQPAVYCTGYARREPYAPIVVGNQDVTGLQWEVDPGARIRGKVVTRSGEPIDGVEIWLRRVTSNDVALTSVARSRRDGRYEAGGLKPGIYRLNARSDRGTEPPDGFSVTVAEGAIVERDLVLDDTGTLAGAVVDSAGVPVPDIQIFATGAATSLFSNTARSDVDGGFTLDGMPPGTYRIFLPRDMGVSVRSVSPGENSGNDQLVTVEPRQTATAKVVMEATTGTIQGTVVDAASAPVSDAYVVAARESEGPGASSSEVARTREDWFGRNKPVLTATDGRFQLTRLAAGTYTVRAYRKGGGEAIAEHIAVGSNPRLQIASTGSIAGNVRRKAGAPPYLRISLRDAKTHYTRSEDFYMSGGHFAVRELPAGHFVLEAEADDSRASINVELGPGENKTGADLELASLVVLTGRIVEHGTQKPVSGMRVFAVPVRSSAEFVSIEGENPESVTDDAGRFTVRRAPVGEVWIRASANNMDSGDVRMLDEVRKVSGTGTIDLGDFRLVSSRIKRGEPIGALGLGFEVPPADTPLDQRAFKISSIDPAGPAASTALQVGDVITTCDGIDVTGVRSHTWWTLTQAPPGTRLTLGTQRGVTVTVVLAPRRRRLGHGRRGRGRRGRERHGDRGGRSWPRRWGPGGWAAVPCGG